MGYWGDFVLARSDGPLGELPPFRAKPGCIEGDGDCLTVCEERAGGWQAVQVCHFLPGDDYDWWLRELVAATGSPALIATVGDSALCQLRGRAPSGAAWSTFLDPESAVASGALEGFGDSEDEYEPDFDGLEDDDADDSDDPDDPDEDAVRRLLDAAPVTAELIVSWAAEAGFQADGESVRELLVQERDPLVEDIFFDLIEACGLPEITSGQP